MTQWHDRPDQQEPRPTWTTPGNPTGLPSPEAVPAGAAAPAPGPYTPVGPPQLWPGPIPLRPLTFGEVFETAFRVLRYNPRTLLGLSFVVLMTTSLLGVLAAAALTAATGGFTGANLEDSPGALTLQLSSLPTGLIAFFLSGILVVPIAEAALGHRLSAGASWARVRGRLLSLLGYLVLTTLLGLLVFVPAGLAIWWAIRQDSGAAIVTTIAISLLYLFVVFLWAGVKFSLAPAAIVLERQGPIAGIRRSFALTRRAFWRTWAIQFLVGIITWLISTVLSSIILGIGAAALVIPVAASSGDGDVSAVTMFVFLAMITLGSALTSTLVQPLASASTAVIYLDRRFRTEALAVELMAAADRERGPRIP